MPILILCTKVIQANDEGMTFESTVVCVDDDGTITRKSRVSEMHCEDWQLESKEIHDRLSQALIEEVPAKPESTTSFLRK